MGLITKMRGWFGLGSAPASASTALVRQAPQRRLMVKTFRPQDILPGKGAGAAVATTYNSSTAVTDGLHASVWVWRCVQLISSAAASVPWKAMRSVGGNYEHEPYSDLQRIIDRPNPGWSRNRFIQETVTSLLLAGEFYQSKIRGKLGARGQSHSVTDGEGKPVNKPVELWVLNPQWIQPIKGGQRRPLIMGYQAKNADPSNIPASEIMQGMFVNPDDPYHGLSPLAAARRDIASDKAAADWQEYAFANRAVPDGIFMVKDFEEVDGEEDGDGDGGWTATVNALRQNYFGAINARAPMVLGETIEWIPLASSMVDSDFQGGRKATKENICAAFGVPVILAGAIEGATYANFGASELWLWKATIIPILDIIKETFNTHLAPEYGPEWRLDYDLAKVTALLPMYAEQVKIAKDLFSMGVPMSDLIEAMNLKIPEYEGSDVGRIPANLVDVRDSTLGDV